MSEENVEIVRRVYEATRELAVLLILVAALSSVGTPDANAYVKRPAELANGCFAIKSTGLNRFVGIDGDGYSATAPRRQAASLYL